jgi:hypothetical protein
MLTAIQFDDQLFLETNEIRDIRPNRLLPAELESSELASAQSEPKFAFGICLVAP